MNITESGTLTLGSCAFQNNGVTGELGNSSSGVVGVKNQAHATITGCNFTSNRQGIAVLNAGVLEVEDCQFSGNGMRTDNESLLFYSDTISISGAGSSATVKKCSLAKSLVHGFNIVEGAAVDIEDTEVTENLGIGLAAGLQNSPPCRITIARSHFTQNTLDGIQIAWGSSESWTT